MTTQRQQANREILERLTVMVEAQPDLRFGQLLVAMKIIEMDVTHSSDGVSVQVKDPFNEESSVTLARLQRPQGGVPVPR